MILYSVNFSFNGIIWTKSISRHTHHRSEFFFNFLNFFPKTFFNTISKYSKHSHPLFTQRSAQLNTSHTSQTRGASLCTLTTHSTCTLHRHVYILYIHRQFKRRYVFLDAYRDNRVYDVDVSGGKPTCVEVHIIYVKREREGRGWYVSWESCP